MCMRRAVGILPLAALLFLPLPPVARAQDAHGHDSNEPRKVTSINGIGMVDYGTRPTFKVGDWVRYHMKAKSELGVTDDYTVTLLIAGEEDFWGDECFWIETWTQHAGGPPAATATLMSYAIFEDSLAIPHMQMYMRKTITGLDEAGRPKQELMKRPASTLTQRKPVGDRIAWNVDTLEAETVTVPKGTFHARKIRIEQGTGVEGQSRDSLSYTEVRENRTVHFTLEVPITHVAVEEVEYGLWRRTWKTGFSREAGALNVLDRSLGRAELVDFGTGLDSKMVPVEVRRGLKEQRRAAAAPARPKRSAGR